MSDESLEILIQIREKLDGLHATTREFREAKKEAKAFGDTARIAMGNFAAKLAHDAVRSATSALRGFITTGIQYIANLEQQTVRLSKFVGGVDAAKQRIGELTQFAARTPYLLNQLVEAVTDLENLTQGELAGDNWLEAIGDAAAGTGNRIEDVAYWVGRLYTAIDSGGVIGEATMRLLEMGVISGDVKNELEGMSDSASAVEVLARAFSRFAGGMDEQSRTINGRLSTLKDNVGVLAGTFISGAKGPEAFAEALEEINDLISGEGFLEDIGKFGGAIGRLASAAGSAARAFRIMGESFGMLVAGMTYNVRFDEAMESVFGMQGWQPKPLEAPKANSGGGAGGGTNARFEYGGREKIDNDLAENARRMASLENDLFTARLQKLPVEIGLLREKSALLQQLHEDIRAEEGRKKTSGDAAGASSLNIEAVGVMAELEEIEMRLQSITTFGGEFSAQITSWANEFQAFGEAAGSIFTDTLTPLTEGFGETLVGVLKQGGDAMDVFRAVGMQMVENLIIGVVNYGMQWLATQALIKMGLLTTEGVTTGLRAKRMMMTKAEGAQAAASHAPGAAAASISSFGGAVLLGLAALAVAMAAFGGFASGGYTGRGGRNQPAGIVHKGEYVFSQADVASLGLPNLERMHNTGRMPVMPLAASPAAPMSLGGGGESAPAPYSVLSRESTVVLESGRRRRQFRDDPFTMTRLVELPGYFTDR